MAEGQLPPGPGPVQIGNVSGKADSLVEVGVLGEHDAAGVGVLGVSKGGGIIAGEVVGVGVKGISEGIGVNGVGAQGVVGAGGANARGILGTQDDLFHQDAGVFGTSNQQGVVGFSSGSSGAGVLGSASQNGTNFDPATGGSGVFGTGYIGIRGETQTGVGVFARVFGTGLAGRFEGDVLITADLSVIGDVFLTNKDLAEQFEVGTSTACQPGMVMVLDGDGSVVPCARPYDRRAVGVISGAGALRPAITLGAFRRSVPTAAIALAGTTMCLADADLAAIDVGDLLTSSETAGHAMKAIEPVRGFGAIIGKALAPLPRGRGLIPILIALQ